MTGHNLVWYCGVIATIKRASIKVVLKLGSHYPLIGVNVCVRYICKLAAYHNLAISLATSEDSEYLHSDPGLILFLRFCRISVGD